MVSEDDVRHLLEERFYTLYDKKETAELQGKWNTLEELEYRIDEVSDLYREFFENPIPVRDQSTKREALDEERRS